MTLKLLSWVSWGITHKEKKEIIDLISKRNEAKKLKNFALADEIRDELKAKNIAIMDTADGTKWEKAWEVF